MVSKEIDQEEEEHPIVNIYIYISNIKDSIIGEEGRRYNTIQYNTIQYNTIQYNTIRMIIRKIAMTLILADGG